MSRPTPPRPDGAADPGSWAPPPAQRWPERLPTAPVGPPPTWRWWEAIGVFLVAIGVSIPLTVTVFDALGGGTGDVVASLVGDAVIAATLVVWLQVRHRGWPSSIGFPRQVGREIGAGAGWGVGIYVAVALLVGGVIIRFLQDITGELVQTPTQVPAHLGGLGQTLLVVRAVVAAPLAEEFFFRVLLFGSLRTRYRFWASAGISSLVFGLVHAYPGSWQGMVALMSTLGIVGISLCALYERRGNIIANVVAHATFNTIGLVLIAKFG